jgi:hypothetical protein
MVQREITGQAPIGYWLKHADEVITKHVNQVLQDNGFTRFREQRRFCNTTWRGAEPMLTYPMYSL